MNPVNLVMPMAGRGSRFAAQGIAEPKPLIDLGGKPFFWWAVESVRRAATIEQMVFVILQEHIDSWSLDQRIRDFYPEALILAMPDVTSGSAETAALGAEKLTGDAPLVINDCDHAFLAPDLDRTITQLQQTVAGTLVTFRSQSPNYSFVQFGPDGSITGTVEKQVVSEFAIAGCYLFGSSELFLNHYENYLRDCPYPELFVSGIYNQMLQRQLAVSQVVLEEHFAFGTPDEYDNVQARMLDRLRDWS